MLSRVDIKTGFTCNNNCKFCAQADHRTFGNRIFQEIAKNLESCSKDCQSVVFTGGEVTIRKDFLQIVEYARDIGYQEIQIQSNGRMFSSKEFCIRAIKAGANEFGIAIHGSNALQHDNLTRSPGSFNQSMKGIRNLLTLDQKVLTNTVIVKSNYKDLKRRDSCVWLTLQNREEAYFYAIIRCPNQLLIKSTPHI